MPRDCSKVAEARMIEPNSDEQLPILLTVSNGRPQMVSGTTREWMALHSLAMHVGRPGTPTDQAYIETFFGHVKTESPELEAIRDRLTLDAAMQQARPECNAVRFARRRPVRHPQRRTPRTKTTDPQPGHRRVVDVSEEAFSERLHEPPQPSPNRLFAALLHVTAHEFFRVLFQDLIDLVEEFIDVVEDLPIRGLRTLVDLRLGLLLAGL